MSEHTHLPASVQTAYGEISVENNTTETAIAVTNTWYQVTVFNTDGEANDATPDHSNDHITINTAGIYMVNVSASILSGSGSASMFEVEVKTNDGVTAHTNVHTDRAMAGGGGDQGSISLSGLIDFAVDDTVELWVRNKAGTTNIVFEDATLTVQQVT